MSLLHFATRHQILQVLCELGLNTRPAHKTLKTCVAMSHPSSTIADFRKFFAKAKHIAIITGAGVSAESGVPTFRGPGGFWRKWKAEVPAHPSDMKKMTQRENDKCWRDCERTYALLPALRVDPTILESTDLATPETFMKNPSLVWEFYHYRRELMLTKNPNPAHIAIAECEARLSVQGRRVVVITQNIDELHRKAGTKNLLEIHGSLFKTRCISCGNVAENYKSPICPALEGKGAPDPDVPEARIPVEKLPKCEEKGCNGSLRPHVVWFGENLDPKILDKVNKELAACDLCLVVGTSSVVYPAAIFAPHVSARGVPVAEFNMETTPVTQNFRFHFSGPCGTTIPEALACHESESVC
ncbi:NAD-dependent protein deacylase sirtuin-5, mitochondrial isoform X3 [Notamacropus eugenii]